MNKFALPVLAAALALGACDSTPEADEAAMADGAATTAAGGDTTVVVPGPTATETTVVAAPADTGDRVSVGPNGVSADVGDADTRVKVNTDGNTVSVEKQ